MKKRLVSVLLATTLLAGLAVGCGNKKEEAKKAPDKAQAGDAKADSKDKKDMGQLKIGLSMPMRDQFLSAFEAAAKDKAQKMNVELTAVDANNNANTQIQSIQTFASSGMKAMIVGLVNTDSLPQVMDNAKTADGKQIPVVFINRRPDMSKLVEGVSTYVGSDEKKAGALEGQFVADFVKKQGKDTVKLVMLQGQLGLENTQSRTESAYKAIEKAGLKIDKVMEQSAEWDRNKATNQMQQLIGKTKDFDAVIANNDEMALGAVTAMEAAGMDFSKIPVVGIDATPDGLKSMKAGKMAFTVFQDAVGQGAGAVEAAVKLAKGEKVPTYIDIPFIPVRVDQVDEYLAKVAK